MLLKCTVANDAIFGGDCSGFVVFSSTFSHIPVRWKPVQRGGLVWALKSLRTPSLKAQAPHFLAVRHFASYIDALRLHFLL